MIINPRLLIMKLEQMIYKDIIDYYKSFVLKSV